VLVLLLCLLLVASGTAPAGALGATASDTEPPVVTPRSPGPNETVVGETVTIRADVVDEIGILPQTARVRLDGEDLTDRATVTDTSVTVTADVGMGPHTVVVSVRDRLGNTGEASWRFERTKRDPGERPDPTPPAYRPTWLRAERVGDDLRLTANTGKAGSTATVDLPAPNRSGTVRLDHVDLAFEVVGERFVVDVATTDERPTDVPPLANRTVLGYVVVTPVGVEEAALDAALGHTTLWGAVPATELTDRNLTAADLVVYRYHDGWRGLPTAGVGEAGFAAVTPGFSVFAVTLPAPEPAGATTDGTADVGPPAVGPPALTPPLVDAGTATRWPTVPDGTGPAAGGVLLLLAAVTTLVGARRRAGDADPRVVVAGAVATVRSWDPAGSVRARRARVAAFDPQATLAAVRGRLVSFDPQAALAEAHTRLATLDAASLRTLVVGAVAGLREGETGAEADTARTDGGALALAAVALVPEWSVDGPVAVSDPVPVTAVGRGATLGIDCTFTAPETAEPLLRGVVVNRGGETLARLAESRGLRHAGGGRWTGRVRWPVADLPTGEYLARLAVEDETTGTRTESVARRFSVGEPLGADAVDVRGVEVPEGVRVGEETEFGVTLANPGERDGSVVTTATLSPLADDGTPVWTETAPEHSVTVPAGGTARWSSGDHRFDEAGEYRVTLDALEFAFTVVVAPAVGEAGETVADPSPDAAVARE
jgi:PGF-pre-PGF domain-containing protein